LPVAIPDHLFKIVARVDSSGNWEFLAFIYPQEDRRYRKGPWDPLVWVASITRIEQLTGQAFLGGAPAAAKTKKNPVASTLWSVKKEHFDSGCKRFAKDIS
jgi:hypothetical protein